MPSLLPKSHWEQFGTWIRKMRRDADMTQKQVADRAGIHEVHVARIEKGESGTKRETVALLAQALGVDKGEALQRAGFSLTEYPATDAEARSLRNDLAHRGDKPRNLPELLAALEGLGIAIDWATFKDNFDNYTPDDFEDLKDQIAANAGVKIKRIKNR